MIMMMMMMTTTSVIFLMMLVVDDGVVWSLMQEPRDEEPLSCYEGRLRCLGDVTCKVLMETIHKVCDNSIHTCQTTQRLHCHSVLTALQSNVHFRNCECNPINEDAVECQQTQRTIFLHSCVKQTGFPSGLDQDSFSAEGKVLDGDLSSSSSDEIDVSCIGVRKDCLLNPRCNRLFNEFRNYCRESKRPNHCQTTEWKRCSAIIESLMQESSDLFQCTCPMRKADIREKCERIRWRLSNNTCPGAFSSVAYYSKLPEPTYDQLLFTSEAYEASILIEQGTLTNSNCAVAFRNCHSDKVCGSQLENLMSVCAWNISSNDCRRKDCSEAIQRFFSIVQVELSRSLLFCSCPSATEDNCLVIRRAVVPACIAIEIPTPSCSDVMARCSQDPRCRERWFSFQQHCRPDSRSIADQCPSGGDAKCQRSVVDVLGTVLTINCTCSSIDLDQGGTVCHEALAKLQQLVSCRETIEMQYLRSSLSPSDPLAEFSPSEEKEDAKVTNTFQPDPGCRRHVGLKIPSFMATPSVIRIYHNATDCSDLCHCHLNYSITCRTLPCAPNLSCKHKDILYGHGSSFMLNDRGPCRCIKAEMICAKAHFQMQPKIGLFLHVGYSVVEQYLIEGHSSVNFQLHRLKSKLSALLNEDSAEQFCSLTLHQNFDGNLIFEIGRSKFSRKSRALDISEVCMTSAKALSHMINSRHWTIITDPELSLLKVSQLERVRFHEQSAKEERKGGLLRSGAAPTTVVISTARIALLTLLHRFV